eukprot:CAMPEP_0206508926 /NCGR_PEP_ID=MMETSP0324_2-20121206/58625_1 /ASSEMBLY_ACC=CAM_ASM_000836 /TAXON_ID=2866 /ORGANISM="Crypthecodinium cohnii, Strain Seligo" /LENGTH=82 /DNA_ID=CAMNT_0053999887 /DNA_START=189 /DNA_END=436 /DNA_ORIENTATION=+
MTLNWSLTALAAPAPVGKPFLTALASGLVSNSLSILQQGMGGGKLEPTLVDVLSNPDPVAAAPVVGQALVDALEGSSTILGL